MAQDITVAQGITMDQGITMAQDITVTQGKAMAHGITVAQDLGPNLRGGASHFASEEARSSIPYYGGRSTRYFEKVFSPSGRPAHNIIIFRIDSRL